MLCMLKKKKCFLLMFQNTIQIVKKQVILLIIPNGAGWHYLALKKPSALDRGIKFQHHGDFYYLNRIHYFIKENKLESDE